jgi:hypothetical protein
MEELPEEVLRAICLQLDGRTAAYLQRTARFLHDVLKDTALWHAFYVRDFGQPTIPPTRVMASGFLDWKGAYGARFLREQRRKVQALWLKPLTIDRVQRDAEDSAAKLAPVRREACAPLYTEGWRGTIYRYDWKAFQRNQQRINGSEAFVHRARSSNNRDHAEPTA